MVRLGLVTGQMKMKGTVSSLWTTGNPSVTLTDNTVVTAVHGVRQHRVRPGDEVLCENISGTWHIVEITKANGPEWTNFIALPVTPALVLTPWYQDSGWTIRGDDAYLRDHNPHTALWLTKNSSGVVSIQGLAGSGAGIAATTVFANLPAGFRPSTIRLFPATVNEVRVHVEVHPDGRILFPGYAVPANSWISLANVIFHDAAQDLNWIAPTTFYNSFALHGSNASYPLGYAIDSFGWIWFRGIVAPGNLVDNNAMFGIPFAYSPLKQHHFAAATNTNGGYLGARYFTSGTGYLDYKSGGTGPTSWISTDGIFYPPNGLDAGLFNGYGPGTSMTGPLGELGWSNSWTNYDTVSFPSASFTKRTDGLVWWHGLIKGGTINTAAMHIPRTYRPLVRVAREVISNATHGRLSFDPEVKYVAPDVGSNLWVSMDGSAYQAAR